MKNKFFELDKQITEEIKREMKSDLENLWKQAEEAPLISVLENVINFCDDIGSDNTDYDIDDVAGMLRHLADEQLRQLSRHVDSHEEKAHKQIDCFIEKNPFLEEQILSREYSIDQRIYSVFGIITSVKAPESGHNNRNGEVLLPASLN